MVIISDVTYLNLKKFHVNWFGWSLGSQVSSILPEILSEMLDERFVQSQV